MQVHKMMPGLYLLSNIFIQLEKKLFQEHNSTTTYPSIQAQRNQGPPPDSCEGDSDTQ